MIKYEYLLNEDFEKRYKKIIFELNQYSSILLRIADDNISAPIESKIYFFEKYFDLEKNKQELLKEILTYYTPNLKGRYEINLLENKLIFYAQERGR